MIDTTVSFEDKWRMWIIAFTWHIIRATNTNHSVVVLRIESQRAVAWLLHRPICSILIQTDGDDVYIRSSSQNSINLEPLSLMDEWEGGTAAVSFSCRLLHPQSCHPKFPVHCAMRRPLFRLHTKREREDLLPKRYHNRVVWSDRPFCVFTLY